MTSSSHHHNHRHHHHQHQHRPLVGSPSPKLKPTLELKDDDPNRNSNNDRNRNSTSNTIISLSTRVCIKNLPPSFTTESQLKEFLWKESPFRPSLTVTDIKILKSKQGKSRKVAFVGFSTPEQAAHVVQYFHKTYCQSSRLTVEFALTKTAAAAAAASLLQKRNQHNKKKAKADLVLQKIQQEHEQKQEQEQTAPITQSDEGDKRKQEFLAAMGFGPEKTKFWANDDAISAPQNAPPKSATSTDADDHDATQTRKSMQDSDNDNSDDDHDDDHDDDDNDNDDASVESNDSGGQGANILQSNNNKNNNKALVVGSVLTDLDFIKAKAVVKDDLDDESDHSIQSDHRHDQDEDKIKDTQPEVESKLDDESSDGSSSDSSSDDSTDDDSDDDQLLHPQPPGTNEQPPSPSIVSKGSTTATEQHIDTDQQNQNNDDDTDENEGNNIDHNRLFVRNLPFSTNQEDVQQLFERFGTVTDCHLPVDDQRNTKGFSFVTFSTSDAAALARNNLDGTDFCGRLLHILPARKSNTVDANTADPNDPSLTYKQKQEILRQQQGNKQTGWSASFVRGDAVVDNLAVRLGLTKGTIFNVKDDLKAGDAAVRLALGETQIIQENRNYFAAHGIDMEALVSMDEKATQETTAKTKSSTKRSTTCILVKNLPFDTEKGELEKLFHAAARILLPPSRTIALVEYEVSVDAKRAFSKWAYKRFKHVPLYLEWAPLAATATMTMKPEASAASTAANNSLLTTTSTHMDTDQKMARNKTIMDEEVGAADDDPSTVSHSIYIKNLNFSTTEEQLRLIFEQHVAVRAVRIPVKAAPMKKNHRKEEEDGGTTKWQSMGFGFVECDSDAAVRKALKVLEGTIVDGHALELKRSSKSLVGTAVPKKPSNISNPTKIMCRNVPFQATRKELLQLFGSFGQLKKVRLPKKMNGQHRGFAFLEFMTPREAESAMVALSSTHLYGRHLVLEWADTTEDDDILMLRTKAKRDLMTTATSNDETNKPKNKKIRFDF